MNKKEQIIVFKGPYLTLGQLLKKLDLIESGGEAKLFLASHNVSIDGETETRRGRKLYDRSYVVIDQKVYQLKEEDAHQ